MRILLIKNHELKKPYRAKQKALTAQKSQKSHIYKQKLLQLGVIYIYNFNIPLNHVQI